MSEEQSKQLMEKVSSAGIAFVDMQFIDVAGTIKTVTIPAHRLGDSLADGIWFDGSAIEGSVRVAESDLFLRPDPTTFAMLPWEQMRTARLICDLTMADGSPFMADPRNALKAVLAEAREMGFDYRVACEVEFFVFEDRGADAITLVGPEPVGRGGYFELSNDRASQLCCTATEALSRFGFEIEMTHHEVAPGQQEIDFAEVGALEAADAIVTLKWALRAFGRREGLLVSFMPKPIEGTSGSGLHIQQRLINPTEGSNAFFDQSGQYQLSIIGGHFIAGQLAHARGMCAVIAPLVNSYKRLMGGAEAPGKVSWARISRGAMIRVPEVGRSTGARVELRAPDPSCNPYLALAVMLKAGLDGIRNSTPLPEPIEEAAHAGELDESSEGIADPLPAMLGEALEECEWDPVVREALGQPIFERFLTAKESEWLAYRRHISHWELRNYLEGA